MLWYYLYAVSGMSALCFFLFALDKLFAKRKKSRISERTLLVCMWLFGAAGGLVAMCLFRHKTSHWYFGVNGVFALIVHLALAWGIVWRFPI